MRKTKIVCTIGPASASADTMKEMIRSGMNVARLNFSHGTHESHKEMIDRLKAVRSEMKAPLAILLDTKGPEIRIKTLKGGFCELTSGDDFLLTGREIEGSRQGVSVSYPNLARNLKPCDRILIDDGKIALVVCRIEESDIHCRVESGGVLRDRKSINLPFISVDMPFLSNRDKADLRFGAEQGVDYVAASFVRCANDVKQLRAYLDEQGGEAIRIISKIENAEGVDNFEEILAESDGIMVARGDMGVEIPFKRIPGIQKKLLRRTCEEGKLSITATHMLESMIEKITPTRAEITDVANAVFDGTSAVMCSGETAMGAHPALVVKTMADIALQAETDADEVDLFKETVLRGSRTDATFAISHAACSIALDIGAKAILAFTACGSSATAVSGFRSAPAILAITDSEAIANRLSLTWGVCPLFCDAPVASERALKTALAYGKEAGLFEKGDSVVMTDDAHEEMSKKTSLVRIASVS